MHVYVRIERRWTFDRGAARRAGVRARGRAARAALATSKWWKEERHGVFLDYNQNAKDRTVARAYSVRPTPDARVSAPLDWDEVDACEPADFTLATMPARFARGGDRHARIDDRADSLEALLELSERQRARGARRCALAAALPQAGRRSAERRSRRAAGCRSIPLIEIARAREKADALAGFDRWKARHPEAAAHLQPADVLVDAMRGRFRTWTRVRVNLQHVPEPLRPPQEALDPGEDMAAEWRGMSDAGEWRRRRAPRARKEP